MLLTLLRQPSWRKTTLGHLFIEGNLECFTLEDVVRGEGEDKVYGETAIPEGHYQLLDTWSPKFGRLMPLVDGVVGFSGVRIHWGNSRIDTEGCIITGRQVTDSEHVIESKVAFDALYAKLKQGWSGHTGVWLDVKSSPPVPSEEGDKE